VGKTVAELEFERLAERGAPRAHKALALRNRRSAFAFRRSLLVFKPLLPQRLKIRLVAYYCTMTTNRDAQQSCIQNDRGSVLLGTNIYGGEFIIGG
jgi:hypothetical protein